MKHAQGCGLWAVGADVCPDPRAPTPEPTVK